MFKAYIMRDDSRWMARYLTSRHRGWQPGRETRSGRRHPAQLHLQDGQEPPNPLDLRAWSDG
jgi:hypothetical protein